MADNTKATVNLEFIENHLPGLKSGEYKISARQELSGPGIATGTFTATFPDYYVAVQGDRFNLKPTEIQSVFPPANSLGEYSNILPHIVFNRNTLPWERMVAPMNNDEATEKALEKVPWLALLVFNEDELVTAEGKAPANTAERMEIEKGKGISFKDLAAAGKQGICWPPKPEPGQSDDEKIRVIYVKESTLAEILPSNEKELTYLSHARQSRIGFKVNDSFTGLAEVVVTNDKDKAVHVETVTITQPSVGASLDTGPLPPGSYQLKITPKGGSAITQTIKLATNAKIGSDVAIVVGNRLPKPGVKTIVHLVSLEERYKSQGGEYVFNTDGFNDPIPLVSLKSWSFSAVSEKQTFRSILLQLNHQFLFGINVSDTLRNDVSIANLLDGFLQGRHALGAKAKIEDKAVKMLKDKDHLYYFGQGGKVYNAAGRYLFQFPGGVPHSEAAAIGKMKGYALHPDSAVLSNVVGINCWLHDGRKNYFLSEESKGETPIGRLQVFLLSEDASPSLRLPDLDAPNSTEVDAANNYLKMGYVPLPHQFRRGGKSVSWYRGPLVTGPIGKTIPDDLFPVHCSDELLRYHTDYGMFDVSYASAWELGRLMALKSKRISVDLYNWKRLHSQQLKALEQREIHAHLPYTQEVNGALNMPQNIENWLGKLSLLKGIPFNYLVPDERMLPIESIRFFYLDPAWIASMMDGALSIGRVDGQQEKILHQNKLVDTASNANQISGFLLRSSVVAGWPTLQINGYDYVFSETKPRPGDQDVDDWKNEGIPELNAAGKSSALEILRMERLSSNVLLCLFQGDAKVVDIHERPEAIHFGFNRSDDLGKDTYYKLPHRSNGEESDQRLDLSTKYFDTASRVLKVENLFNELKDNLSNSLGYNKHNYTSAQFALSLVEGVERVRFIHGSK